MVLFFHEKKFKNYQTKSGNLSRVEEITKEKLDPWYNKFREFLQSKDLIDKRARIWNADETGFNMGGNKTKVIGHTQR